MSEQLRKHGYLNSEGVVAGDKVGEYESFVIGDVTMKQLQQAGITRKREIDEEDRRRKPDGLVVDRRDPQAPVVRLIIEDKDKGELNTEAKLAAVMQKCAQVYCPLLECDLFAVTDGTDTYWGVGQSDGSYVRISQDDAFPLHHSAAIHDIPSRDAMHRLLQTLDEALDRSTGIMSTPDTANPTVLADRVWQAVWLASGANPDACLSTFIEILLFKFLSDLGVLVPRDGIPVDFQTVRALPDATILKYYSNNVRPAIKSLFPANPVDNTSVINGTVLDPENSDHGRLFARMLSEFNRFGSLRRINPEFKSRIFERFLKKTISQKNWGQFFTPRNVVKAMVEMSDIEYLTAGSVVCDPACGVGGFILEPLINKRPTDFRGGPTLTYRGLDRDQKTIILAKANMLVHLSDLLEADPVGGVPGLAAAINDTFTSLDKYISGSLAEAPREEYDLVLTNPPYVVSGTTEQKKMLASDDRLADYYDTGSMGVEGLFMQLIIRGLKKGGRALVVVPDGMLFRHGDKPLRKFIMAHCDIEAVISLPRDTFYTTSKKTYILVLRKRLDPQRPQTNPVFTYLIRSVGESLDTHRFITDDNDLLEMVKQFRVFAAYPGGYTAPQGLPLCRVQPVTVFTPADSWVVDHWWSDSELEELGAVESKAVATPRQFATRLGDLREHIAAVEDELMELSADAITCESVEVRLDDTKVFTLGIGKRVTKTRLRAGIRTGPVPLYSANPLTPFAFVHPRDLPRGCFKPMSFGSGSVRWGIDGDWTTVPSPAHERFATTDHCGRIELVAKDLSPEYVAAAVLKAGAGLFTREYRPSKERIAELTIRIPIDDDGNYDLAAQEELAARFHKVVHSQREVQRLVAEALDVIPEPLDIT